MTPDDGAMTTHLTVHDVLNAKTTAGAGERMLRYVETSVEAVKAIAKDGAGIETERVIDEHGKSIAVYSTAGGFQCWADDTWIAIHNAAADGKSSEPMKAVPINIEVARELVDATVRALLQRLVDASLI
jgi:hypothetical protein